MDILKSGSKILAFVIALMAFIFVLVYGSKESLEAAGQILLCSFLISALLIGNKTVIQAVEKFISAKFTGGK